MPDHTGNDTGSAEGEREINGPPQDLPIDAKKQNKSDSMSPEQKAIQLCLYLIINSQKRLTRQHIQTATASQSGFTDNQNPNGEQAAQSGSFPFSDEQLSEIEQRMSQAVIDLTWVLEHV